MSEILESTTVALSLAIYLVDEFTMQQPIGNLNVSVNGGKFVPVKNPSGYYLLFKPKVKPEDDIENLQVNVKSDYYFEENLEVQLSSLDPKEPLKRIELKPNPSYPFPNGTTLIRGVVVEPPSDVAASSATVEIAEKGLQTKTSSKGEYVLYFQPLTQDDVVREEAPLTDQTMRYVKTAAGKQLEITAHDENYSGSLTVISVSEGISNNVKYIQLK
jgi:hypothetical protein